MLSKDAKRRNPYYLYSTKRNQFKVLGRREICNFQAHLWPEAFRIVSMYKNKNAMVFSS